MTTELGFIFISGFMTGLGLIMAIGSQNVFVIKEAIRGQYGFLVALICSVSDALLVFVGGWVSPALFDSFSTFKQIIPWLGCVFLLVYGLLSLWRGIGKSPNNSIDFEKRTGTLSLSKIILIALGFSLFNPHAILDTIVLLGGMIQSHETTLRAWFASGIILSSFTWFFFLVIGAQKFSKTIKSRNWWNKLELVSGTIMLTIAFNLATRLLESS